MLQKVLSALTILFTAVALSAISFNDTGWIDYGKTERTKQFTKREIGVNSPDMGRTGIIYIHKKGESTRGSGYPYLPFGIATFQRNWRMSGLFDFRLNGENQYIYKHLSAVPTFEYIDKTFEAITVKITFPCGSAGNILLFVHVSKDNNYFDFTFDLSEFNQPVNDLTIVFNCAPGHAGSVKKDGKQIKVPFNRIFHTATRTINHQANIVASLNKDENWVLLYDLEPAYGSCAIMFDPQTIDRCTLNGKDSIALSASVKKDKKKIRFLLWEFNDGIYNNESAYAAIADNSSQLLQYLREEPKLTGASAAHSSYKAEQVKTPPAMNAKMDDSTWRAAEWSTPFYDLKSAQTANKKTQFKAVYDAKNLYLLIRCEEKYPAKIVANETVHDKNAIFRDDSLEIFLSPQNTSANYLHLCFNTLGTKWDAIEFRGGKNDKSWNPEWDVVVDRDASGWTAEVKIPFMSMLLNSDVNDKWMLNVARNKQAGKGEPGHQAAQTWSKISSGKFNDPDSFNELTGINEDLHYAMQQKKFDEYGMTVQKRGDIAANTGIEIVAPGSEKAFLYYPNKEIYLPSDQTVLRTLFNVKNANNEIRNQLRTISAKNAQKKLDNVAFHFLLPEGVTVATDEITARITALKVTKLNDRHIILEPQWPESYGALWPSINLETIPVFLKHNLKTGQRVPIDSWIEFKSPAEKTAVVRSYINIVNFPWIKQMPKHFSLNQMWTFYTDVATYPDYTKTMKKSGFTGIPFFAGDLLYDGGQNQKSYSKNLVDAKRVKLISIADEARHLGLGIYLNDTTFNKVGFNSETQWGGIKWSGVPLGNPMYRGPIYQDDIADLTTAYKLLGGADRITMDIECYKRVAELHFGFFDKGGQDAEKVRQLAKDKGTTEEDIFTDSGTEMMKDIQAAIRKVNESAGIKQTPALVIWNLSADEANPMEGLFDYRKLYPQFNQYLNPHVYFESDSRKIGNRIKFHRRAIDSNNIIACMTTQWQRDDLSFAELRDQILECFYNGAGGIDYWPLLFDQNDTYGQLLALREILPFETIIWNGKFTCQTGDAAPTQIVGFVYKNEAVLLVSNYQRSNSEPIKIINPLKQKTKVYNVSDDKLIGEVAADEDVDIKLGERRTAVIYFGNNFK